MSWLIYPHSRLKHAFTLCKGLYPVLLLFKRMSLFPEKILFLCAWTFMSIMYFVEQSYLVVAVVEFYFIKVLVFIYFG